MIADIIEIQKSKSTYILEQMSHIAGATAANNVADIVFKSFFRESSE